jgi:hypothetical protein
MSFQLHKLHGVENQVTGNDGLKWKRQSLTFSNIGTISNVPEITEENLEKFSRISVASITVTLK